METFLIFLAFVSAPVWVPVVAVITLVGAMIWGCLFFSLVTPFLPRTGSYVPHTPTFDEEK